MGTMTILRTTYPRLTGQLKRPVSLLSRIGDHMLFYLKALGGVPHAAVHFRREIIRLIAEISMGAGTLAMIGGTVVIVEHNVPFIMSLADNVFVMELGQVIASGPPETVRRDERVIDSYLGRRHRTRSKPMSPSAPVQAVVENKPAEKGLMR